MAVPLSHMCVITGYLCFKHGSVAWKWKSGSTDELLANRTALISLDAAIDRSPCDEQ